MPQNIASFKRKLTAHSLMAFLLIVFGMVVVMVALLIPPQGEIHPTVITVFGMVLVAAGAFMGIDLNFQFKHFAELIREKDKSKIDSQNVTD